MAGGVPEVMLHLRRMGLLNLDVLTVTGATLARCSIGGSRAIAGARRARASGSRRVDPDA